MPKLSTIGLGKYIRSPRDPGIVWQLTADEGNTFRCHPVTGKESTRVIIDLTRYRYLPKDADGEEVTL